MKNTDKKSSLKKKQKVIAIIIACVVIVAIVIALVLLFKKEDVYNEPINENFSFLVDEESTLLANYDIFGDQNDISKKILDEYKKGKYTIDNPYIVENPYLISPHTALVLFKTDKKEKVKMTLKGKHDDDLVVEFEASKDHYLPVYGLYAEHTNQIIFETASGKKHTVEIKVDKTNTAEKIEVLTNNVKNSNGEFYFGTTALGTASLAVDNYGEIRWLLTEDYSKGMVMLQNGHLLISDVTEGPNAVSTGGVIEVDMLGYIHKQYEIQGGYHHDAYEMKNGNLLITSGDVNSDTFCDVIYEIDRESGQVVKTVDLKSIVKAVDPDAIEYGEITWGFTNSVFLDETRGELVLSLRNRNTVMALDYKSLTIKWMLGEDKYWTNNFNKYFLKAVGNDFIYPGGQHSIIINEDGNLSIFNNGYNSYREETVSCGSLRNNESYGMIYAIDRDNMTARVLYKFGGQKYFSYALSSFNYSKEGHKIFNSGWHFSTDEVYNDTSCTQFSNDKYDAYIVELDDNDNVLVEIRINESKFEVIKAPIYNLEALSVTPKTNKTVANYEFDGEARYLTNLPSPEYEKLTEADALAYKENSSNPISFFILNNRMSFQGLLLNSAELKVTLISPKGIAYRYTVKEQGKDEYKVLNLNDLPKGRYYIYVNLDDTIYNSTQYIVI